MANFPVFFDTLTELTADMAFTYERDSSTKDMWNILDENSGRMVARFSIPSPEHRAHHSAIFSQFVLDHAIRLYFQDKMATLIDDAAETWDSPNLWSTLFQAFLNVADTEGIGILRDYVLKTVFSSDQEPN